MVGILRFISVGSEVITCSGLTTAKGAVIGIGFLKAGLLNTWGGFEDTGGGGGCIVPGKGGKETELGVDEEVLPGKGTKGPLKVEEPGKGGKGSNDLFVAV